MTRLANFFSQIYSGSKTLASVWFKKKEEFYFTGPKNYLAHFFFPYISFSLFSHSWVSLLFLVLQCATLIFSFFLPFFNALAPYFLPHFLSLLPIRPDTTISPHVICERLNFFIVLLLGTSPASFCYCIPRVNPLFFIIFRTSRFHLLFRHSLSLLFTRPGAKHHSCFASFFGRLHQQQQLKSAPARVTLLSFSHHLSSHIIGTIIIRLHHVSRQPCVFLPLMMIKPQSSSFLFNH